MKVLLSAIFLVLSLVCGVQGQAECIQEGYDDLWEGSGPMLCGCQLHDADDNPLVNISLDFFDMQYVHKYITIVVICVFRLNTARQSAEKMALKSIIVTPRVRAIPVAVMTRR